MENETENALAAERSANAELSRQLSIANVELAERRAEVEEARRIFAAANELLGEFRAESIATFPEAMERRVSALQADLWVAQAQGVADAPLPESPPSGMSASEWLAVCAQRSGR